MLVSDLLHSCANDRVAAAAVSSIGGVFALRVQDEADRGGVTIGAYTAQCVSAFAASATERDWRDLIATVRGHDHPVLAGLQLILEQRGLQAIGARRERPMGARPLHLPTAAAA